MSDPRKLPTVTVNFNLHCPVCRKKGAIERDDGSPGLCMHCLLKRILRKTR